MKAPAFALALALLHVCAQASPQDDEPLEPEKAFPLSARVVKDPRAKAVAIDLRLGVHPGYYLYRDRFKIQAPGLATGPIALPQGVAKEDPFVGRSRVFKSPVTLRLPLQVLPASGRYEVTVTAQGCAEDRVCYAPFAQTVLVSIP